MFELLSMASESSECNLKSKSLCDLVKNTVKHTQLAN